MGVVVVQLLLVVVVVVVVVVVLVFCRNSMFEAWVRELQNSMFEPWVRELQNSMFEPWVELGFQVFEPSIQPWVRMLCSPPPSHPPDVGGYLVLRAPRCGFPSATRPSASFDF